jgi:hypothetical protein
MSAEPSCEILGLVLGRPLWRVYLDELAVLPAAVLSGSVFHTVWAGLSAEKRTLPNRSRRELPTGLSDTGNTALIGEFPETDATNAELPVDGARPAAQHATVHLAGGKLRRPLGSGDL